MMFFPFNVALAMIGFFVSTIAPNSKASNTASYAIVLLAIVVQSFVSDNNLLTFIFTTNASSLVEFLRAFLVIYPPFSYTKVFSFSFRSSLTLPCFLAIILILRNVHGSRAHSHTLGSFSQGAQAAHFPLEAALLKDTLIYPRCSFSMGMPRSLPCWPGTSIISFRPIAEEANLFYSQFIG